MTHGHDYKLSYLVRKWAKTYRVHVGCLQVPLVAICQGSPPPGMPGRESQGIIYLV